MVDIRLCGKLPATQRTGCMHLGCGAWEGGWPSFVSLNICLDILDTGGDLMIFECEYLFECEHIGGLKEVFNFVPDKTIGRPMVCSCEPPDGNKVNLVNQVGLNFKRSF